jgi:hypothetical protein
MDVVTSLYIYPSRFDQNTNNPQQLFLFGMLGISYI